jgi:hypothetical protein
VKDDTALRTNEVQWKTMIHAAVDKNSKIVKLKHEALVFVARVSESQTYPQKEKSVSTMKIDH